MFARVKIILVATLLTGLGLCSQSDAAWLGTPTTLRHQIDKMVLAQAVLPPFAYSRFCARYSEECRPHGVSLRRPKIVELDAQHMKDLVEVNWSVNSQIVPMRYTKADYYNSWSIAPHEGDCNDFAVTKRHELLARGWPSSALLLAEVVTPRGVHHMVLVARTAERDIVLDNLSPSLRAWSRTGYAWVRVQSPTNPALWATISSRNA